MNQKSIHYAADVQLPALRLIAFALSQLWLSTSYAQAQPAVPPSAAANSASPAAKIETIHISGQRASLRKALAIQEQADHIVSVVSSDDIGQLPDKNAAEALARLPGVAVQRDQGEGRYVVVRGLGPDYNAVTINGALVPSPEAGRRAVALDVLPAGIIRTLEVSKTLTPERDASSLGATVEVKSLSAFDLPGAAWSMQAGVSHDSNLRKTSPNVSALWAKRWLDNRLGIAIGASLEKREFASDNVETGGAWKAGRLSAIEWRDYLPVRERQALAVNLDFRPQAGQSYYLRSFVSRFSDDEVRDRLSLSNFAKPIAENEVTTARAERRLRARKYTQDIRSFVLGSEHQINAWKLALAAGFSRAAENTPESINDARFRSLSNVAGVGFVDSQQPQLLGPASLQDSANYQLQSMTLQARDSQDKEQHLRWDLARQFHIGEANSELKFGAKWSRREKTNDTEQWLYNSSKASSPNYWGAGSTNMSSFTQADLDYPFAKLGAGLNPQLLRARLANLDRAAARSLQESAINDYQMREHIDAAYLQHSTSLGQWQVLWGVRYEHTNFSANGSLVQGASIAPQSQQKSYANWLPNLQARYDVDSQTSVRAAWTNSLVRANFSQLAPGVNLISNTEAVIGNPHLKPLKSHNLDLGIERMLGKSGAVSAYLFAKEIKNFTYTTDLAGSEKWANYTSAVSYANGDQAQVRGLEFSYWQALHGLPAPWNGVLLGVNGSLIHANAQVGRFDKTSGAMLTRQIRLPGQSKRIMNLMLGYESGPISARLALNYKSAYLLELGNDILEPTQERIVAGQKQLDLSFAYQINRQLQLVFEGSNLNNEKYYVYQGNRAYNAQYEQYGRTFKISLKANLGS